MNTRTFVSVACLVCVAAGVALSYAAKDVDEARADTVASRSMALDQSFERIDFEGSATINVVQATGGEASIDLSATDEVLRNVQVEVAAGTLFVEVDDDTAASDLVIEITVAHGLSEVVCSGAVKLASEGLRTENLRVEDRGAGRYRFAALRADELVVEARGASQFRIDGEVDRQLVHIAGAGAYDAPALLSRSTEINLKGAGQADVHASETLTVHISGAGVVQYAGGAEVRQRIFGAGVVRARDDA